MFQKDQPEANLQQALVSQPNNNFQSGVQTKRERRDYSLLQFCNSYCTPLTAARQEATCKESTAIAVEKEAGLCTKTTANAVKMAVEKTVEKEAGLCTKTTANAVKIAMEKTVEKEAKSCKKSISDAVQSCKKNSIMVERVGQFKASRNNKIGEIQKYYHNYEFSMDLRFAASDLQKRHTQLIVGIV